MGNQIKEIINHFKFNVEDFFGKIEGKSELFLISILLNPIGAAPFLIFYFNLLQNTIVDSRVVLSYVDSAMWQNELEFNEF